MLLKNKLEKFKSILKSDNVLTKLEERYCYATDATNNTLNLRVPDLVIFVETIEEIQKIVKYANEHKIPIISRGAGTNMVGACLTPEGGIVLNFSKMNKIQEFSPENMTIKVQPGVILGEIKRIADNFGLYFPPDPSNFKVSTIGGAIAQSSSGAHSFKYGTIKDYVLSLKIVTADGRLMNLGTGTMKDTSGYHLNQLIIGSEGTLGIIVEATLKLIPKPEHTELISAYFDTTQNAIDAVNKIVTSNIFPAAIDFMDKNSINTVEDFKHCNLERNSECMLIIELDGLKNSIKYQVEYVTKILEEYNCKGFLVSDNNLSEQIWEARHSSFAAASRLAPDVISDDIIVPREHLATIIQECNNICNKYNLKVCIVGHVGDGNIHPQIVLNTENEEEYRNYQNAKAEIYKLVYSLNGTISAEHGIGIEKMAYLENIISKDSLNLMKSIKKVFDPNNILNPGKIFKL